MADHSSSDDRYQGIEDLFRIRKDLKIHHKIIFVSLVFLGLVLTWYGVWTAIAEIPYIQQPLVALVLGVVVLVLTGKTKDLT